MSLTLPVRARTLASARSIKIVLLVSYVTVLSLVLQQFPSLRVRLRRTKCRFLSSCGIPYERSESEQSPTNRPVFLYSGPSPCPLPEGRGDSLQRGFAPLELPNSAGHSWPWNPIHPVLSLRGVLRLKDDEAIPAQFSLSRYSQASSPLALGRRLGGCWLRSWLDHQNGVRHSHQHAGGHTAVDKPA